MGGWASGGARQAGARRERGTAEGSGEASAGWFPWRDALGQRNGERMTASLRAWRRHAKTAAPLVWVALVALLAASAIASGLAGGSGAVAGGGPSGAASGLSAPAETATPPKITKQPANKTVNEGEPASFESTASGT